MWAYETEGGIGHQEWLHRTGQQAFSCRELGSLCEECAVFMQVDIFSFGMFLYELIGLYFPFEKQNLMGSQIEKLIIEGERPPLQNRVSAALRFHLT